MTSNNGLTELLLLFAAISCCSSTNTETDSIPIVTYCPDLTPQSTLNWTQVLGKWHVAEVLMHSIDPKKPLRSGRIFIKSCPIVTLRTREQGNSPSTVELLWNETKGDLEYLFSIKSPYEPGRWEPIGTQNGKLMSKAYVQFKGIVRIMKAVDTHMVLTFCSTTPDNSKYSFVLSKKRYLPERESVDIQKLLSSRGLTIVQIQESCNNSGNRKEPNNIVQWITLLVAIAATAGQIFTTRPKNMPKYI